LRLDVYKRKDKTLTYNDGALHTSHMQRNNMQEARGKPPVFASFIHMLSRMARRQKH
jgi:hypothetical protein